MEVELSSWQLNPLPPHWPPFPQPHRVSPLRQLRDPGDLPDPGIELTSPAWEVNPLPLSHLGNSMTHQWVTKSIHWVTSDFQKKKATIEKLK